MRFKVIRNCPRPHGTALPEVMIRGSQAPRRAVCGTRGSRSKCLLISWLQSPSAVILEPRKIKSDTVSTVSPSISLECTSPLAVPGTALVSPTVT